MPLDNASDLSSISSFLRKRLSLPEDQSIAMGVNNSADLPDDDSQSAIQSISQPQSQPQATQPSALQSSPSQSSDSTSSILKSILKTSQAKTAQDDSSKSPLFSLIQNALKPEDPQKAQDEANKQHLAMAITTFAPALIGGVVGGWQGAAGGGQVGQNMANLFMTEEQKRQAEQDKSKADLKNALIKSALDIEKEKEILPEKSQYELSKVIGSEAIKTEAQKQIEGIKGQIQKDVENLKTARAKDHDDAVYNLQTDVQRLKDAQGALLERLKGQNALNKQNAANQGALDKQGLANQGSLDKQNAANQGAIDKQHEANNGAIDKQVLANEGSIDKQGMVNQGSLANTQTKGTSAKELQQLKDENALAVQKLKNQGAQTNQKLKNEGQANKPESGYLEGQKLRIDYMKNKDAQSMMANDKQMNAAVQRLDGVARIADTLNEAKQGKLVTNMQVKNLIEDEVSRLETGAQSLALGSVERKSMESLKGRFAKLSETITGSPKDAIPDDQLKQLDSLVNTLKGSYMEQLDSRYKFLRDKALPEQRDVYDRGIKSIHDTYSKRLGGWQSGIPTPDTQEHGENDQAVDPKISDYAKRFNLTYGQASMIISNRLKRQQNGGH